MAISTARAAAGASGGSSLTGNQNFGSITDLIRSVAGRNKDAKAAAQAQSAEVTQDGPVNGYNYAQRSAAGTLEATPPVAPVLTAPTVMPEQDFTNPNQMASSPVNPALMGPNGNKLVNDVFKSPMPLEGDNLDVNNRLEDSMQIT